MSFLEILGCFAIAYYFIVAGVIGAAMWPTSLSSGFVIKESLIWPYVLFLNAWNTEFADDNNEDEV